MMNRVKRLLGVMLSLIIVFSIVAPCTASTASAAADPLIVVSLGDSYSSGEGNPPFYGQEPSNQKRYNLDWLAHRSQNSWEGRLTVGDYGPLKNYWEKGGANDECKWYFRAASGAVTSHIYSIIQNKTYKKGFDVNTEPLPVQISVFSEIPHGTVDYVTMTIGGNDAGFSSIVAHCYLYSNGDHFLGLPTVDNDLKAVWDDIDTIKNGIKTSYYEIQDEAGSQAHIIIAGYPDLFVAGFGFNKHEEEVIAESVTKFNKTIKGIVEECQRNGMNIHFVDVEEKFHGHQLNSSDPWITDIILLAQEEDINHYTFSKYSCHPNEKGLQAYAECVQEKIDEIENSGTLSGNVCKASDRTSPISGARIGISKVYDTYCDFVGTVYSDSSGQYSKVLPQDNYKVDISADGYIPFSAYAPVPAKSIYYMETLLMVAGSPDEEGVAKGKITNAKTGSGLSGVTLTFRKDWNNSLYGDIEATAVTDSGGNYSVTLPLGNYTLSAEKDGYVSNAKNIIVQSGTSSDQNCSLTPVSSSEEYRIVLTWGANPSDLDSHVAGTLSDYSAFHVYYSNKSAYDGGKEICNLDVDDTTSYGPETITLTPVSSEPYYYYIHRYAGSGSIATSGAKIEVYRGSNLINTFNAPTNLGSSDYWNVFAIVDGELIVRNTITSSPETSYTGSDSGRLRMTMDDFMTEITSMGDIVLNNAEISDLLAEKIAQDGLPPKETGEYEANVNDIISESNDNDVMDVIVDPVEIIPDESTPSLPESVIDEPDNQPSDVPDDNIEIQIYEDSSLKENDNASLTETDKALSPEPLRADVQVEDED